MNRPVLTSLPAPVITRCADFLDSPSAPEAWAALRPVLEQHPDYNPEDQSWSFFSWRCLSLNEQDRIIREMLDNPWPKGMDALTWARHLYETAERQLFLGVQETFPKTYHKKLDGRWLEGFAGTFKDPQAFPLPPLPGVSDPPLKYSLRAAKRTHRARLRPNVDHRKLEFGLKSLIEKQEDILMQWRAKTWQAWWASHILKAPNETVLDHKTISLFHHVGNVPSLRLLLRGTVSETLSEEQREEMGQRMWVNHAQTLIAYHAAMDAKQVLRAVGEWLEKALPDWLSHVRPQSFSDLSEMFPASISSSSRGVAQAWLDWIPSQLLTPPLLQAIQHTVQSVHQDKPTWPKIWQVMFSKVWDTGMEWRSKEAKAGDVKRWLGQSKPNNALEFLERLHAIRAVDWKAPAKDMDDYSDTFYQKAPTPTHLSSLLSLPFVDFQQGGIQLMEEKAQEWRDYIQQHLPSDWYEHVSLLGCLPQEVHTAPMGPLEVFVQEMIDVITPPLDQQMVPEDVQRLSENISFLLSLVPTEVLQRQMHEGRVLRRLVAPAHTPGEGQPVPASGIHVDWKASVLLPVSNILLDWVPELRLRDGEDWRESESFRKANENFKFIMNPIIAKLQEISLQKAWGIEVGQATSPKNKIRF